MKVAIIGHIEPAKTTIIEALVKAVEQKTGEQVEFVNVHANEKDFFTQPIREKAISITNEMRCNLLLLRCHEPNAVKVSAKVCKIANSLDDNDLSYTFRDGLRAKNLIINLNL